MDIEKIDFESLDGIVPITAIDIDTREVLSIGTMNKESLEKTLETKRVHYYDKTQNSIGKTDQYLLVLDSSENGKSLLAQVVDQKDERDKFVEIYSIDRREEPYRVIKDLRERIKFRAKNPIQDSYTTKLLENNIDVIQSLRESIENLESNKIMGISDLMFLIFIYLQKNNIEYRKVLFELKKRMGKKQREEYEN